MRLEGCVADTRCLLGEGPIWVARDDALYWTDIKGRRIFRLAADGRLTEWAAPFRVGSLAPRERGGFIAGTDEGFAHIDPAADRWELLFDPEPNRTSNRFNDGKVDRAGRFWAGTMDDTERDATGALYRLTPDLHATRVDDGYRVSNGPAFSPDGRRMYHTDSARQIIYAFDIDGDGQSSNRDVLLRFGEGDGYPDGMTVDAEGCLWVAFWDAWCVRRFSPAGECIDTIKVPVQRPTSCAFGGPDCAHLFITSARIDLDDAALGTQPLAGGLFAVKPGVGGVPEQPFRG